MTAPAATSNTPPLKQTTSETSVSQASQVATKTPFNPIQFVSIISRTDKPLYIQSFGIDDTSTDTTENANKFLKYNFLSHMALDIFTSPESLSLRGGQSQTQQQTDANVVLLFIQDQVMVYGYETNNGLKIIVGLDQSFVIQDQRILRQLFLDIHKCYLRTIFNPFSKVNDEEDDDDSVLSTPTFDKNIKKIVDGWTR
ncbi:uncharacterized protein SPAPADRAFT_58960 [Spathaspora passalidarum NRRL Y-27907]|uniref:Sedlin n=1 Tax=Spathaspora passalidarum (strain NRRL Y-27907 / 11-Y1) TaxID=619300 RepID=G3AES7_SPAPN|nr:uncharacterized protein SPAPADRAFT_58960 [Spathaspora passalidarum NRRL Y-27907]EGW35757.1 hypothetical protein SPAPADRAFT_58960 [Spathaspora passalidarum NRRL Y-27907]